MFTALYLKVYFMPGMTWREEPKSAREVFVTMKFRSNG
jgi:hypothetical protein